MNLTFHIFRKRELQEYETWFTDPEMARRIAFPDAQWFAYVGDTPGVYAWMINDDETPTGQMQLDIGVNKHATFSVAVKAEYRGQGYGKRMVYELLKRPEVSGLTCINGYVEADNLASQRCLTAAGFRLMDDTPDEDGMLKYTYTF